MSKTCIRVLADPVQIKECKESLNQLDEQLDQATRIFNLSGNPMRLKILFLLFKEGEMCPCDLSDVLDISVGGVSQHLRKLKDGKLVKDKKVGQTVFYSLIEENIRVIKPVLKSLFDNNKREPVS
ncbi:MAG: metalloregulator ArsR/SmtB family transcription factor [Imperialibacter sp.]|uniref:Metalloregulator ArsR/SmtB family transcription factor n=1 Tax=Imperialibacter roseus TaxID=1324217 RepID=A0ABZ0IU62_9BACT|nr:metalloregulator ArsR/SmtB family transcription factor [Imperialibacter roseus]WOK07236.1 metalloregulator ArsR/SmtB family transcription factor [Imperialibacter roseus]